MQEIIINKLKKLEFASNESYKRLRTNIQFSGDDVKVIVVTSCMPYEGKSCVSFNLAVSMAEAGNKVLFIDADMRKSVLVGRYKLKVDRGLTHFLSGQSEIGDVICRTDIGKLHMILAGPVPPNPVELIDSRHFKEMLKATRTVYDYIIIDTPPLGSVVDSVIAAKEADGVIMVVEANSTSYKFAQKVKSQLESTGCRILGAVLNKVNLKNKQYGKYYGKYYAKYYGKAYGHEANH